MKYMCLLLMLLCVFSIYSYSQEANLVNINGNYETVLYIKYTPKGSAIKSYKIPATNIERADDLLLSGHIDRGTYLFLKSVEADYIPRHTGFLVLVHRKYSKFPNEDGTSKSEKEIEEMKNGWVQMIQKISQSVEADHPFYGTENALTKWEGDDYFCVFHIGATIIDQSGDAKKSDKIEYRDIKEEKRASYQIKTYEIVNPKMWDDKTQSLTIESNALSHWFTTTSTTFTFDPMGCSFKATIGKSKHEDPDHEKIYVLEGVNKNYIDDILKPKEEKILAQSQEMKKNTLVFKNLYLGMDIYDAATILNTKYGEILKPDKGQLLKDRIILVKKNQQSKGSTYSIEIGSEQATQGIAGLFNLFGSSDIDDSPNAGAIPIVRINADENKKITGIFIGGAYTDKLVTVNDLSGLQFTKMFIENYNIPKMDSWNGTLNVLQGLNTLGLLADAEKTGWYYVSPQGYNIIITTGKDIILKKAPKKAERSFD